MSHDDGTTEARVLWLDPFQHKSFYFHHGDDVRDKDDEANERLPLALLIVGPNTIGIQS